jgi:hypothetical protein
MRVGIDTIRDAVLLASFSALSPGDDTVSEE